MPLVEKPTRLGGVEGVEGGIQTSRSGDEVFPFFNRLTLVVCPRGGVLHEGKFVRCNVVSIQYLIPARWG